MGPLAQNSSQSAAWPKPACDWATFGKIGGSRQSSVEIALGWPISVPTEISVRFHPWGAHTPTHRTSVPRRSLNPILAALLTQIDRSQQSAAMQQGSDPHTARVRSVSESTGACMRPHAVRLQERVLAPGGPAVGQGASQAGQAGAIKGKARAGGGRHACPRRGRSACGVGRSCRIEGQAGRRVLVLQEKS